MIHSAHTVGLHRGYRLTEKDEVEAWEGLYGWMVGNVAVYLLSGLVAQGVVAAWYEAALVDKGDMPEGHVADDVPLHHLRLVLPVMDDGGKWQGDILTDGHHCPREIYVMEIVLHSCDVIIGSFLNYQHLYPCTCFKWH